MSLNGYDSAFEQATNDRAEIRMEIERLLNRGEMLDKLLECLAPFVSSPQPRPCGMQKRTNPTQPRSSEETKSVALSTLSTASVRSGHEGLALGCPLYP